MESIPIKKHDMEMSSFSIKGISPTTFRLPPLHQPLSWISGLREYGPLFFKDDFKNSECHKTRTSEIGGGESDREIWMVPACVILSLGLWQKKMKSLDSIRWRHNIILSSRFDFTSDSWLGGWVLVARWWQVWHPASISYSSKQRRIFSCLELWWRLRLNMMSLITM